MGRGRAKAKQTKVARELKYRNHNTDLDQLQRELSAERSSDRDSRADIDEADDDYTSSYPRD